MTAKQFSTVSADEVNASCRLPVLLLLLGAGFWLAVSAVFGLIASLKFHSPILLADTDWLTYGRVRPAQINTLIYGAGIQIGLAVSIWLIARLGQVRLAQPLLIAIGALLWNLGVVAGGVGILSGEGSGYEALEFPRYANVLLLLAYLLIAVWALMTFHRRRSLTNYPSLWLIVAALFWFPWIFSTASLLLQVYPGRGLVGAVIAWWYAGNLQGVWFTLIGLSVLFYFLPLLTGRDLYSREMVLVVFWMVILAGSWTGIPVTTPLPTWIPAASSAATFATVVTLAAVGVIVHRTLGGDYGKLLSTPALSFLGFGAVSFFAVGLMNLASAFPRFAHVTDFTWYTVARNLLAVYGFFTMTLFGALYVIIPQLVSVKLKQNFGRGHFWCAAGGVVLLVVPLALAGLVEGLKLRHLAPFPEVFDTAAKFLRPSILGDLLWLLASAAFFVNVGILVVRHYRAGALSVFARATAVPPSPTPQKA